MLGLIRKWRRGKLRKKPFPPHWIEFLEKRVGFYPGLAPQTKEKLHQMLKVFVWEKHFFPGKGLDEVTQEMKVVISAAAVRLVLHRDLSYYDRLSQIIVYPHDYRHPGQSDIILGEAHAWGTVVLSWPAVCHGLKNTKDGLDTSTHEFAHVLDRLDGDFDGTPPLDKYNNYRPWARVMSRHFLALQKGERNERKVLRPYGAQNEAEFFAVASEAFFEKGLQMKKRLPELYEELKKFYGFDPANQD